MKQIVLVFGVILTVLHLGVGSTQAFEPKLMEVKPPVDPGSPVANLENLKNWRDELVGMGFDVGRCGHNPVAGSFHVEVRSDEQLQQLTGAGFSILSEQSAGPLGDGLRTDPQYFDPGEILTIINQAAANYPNITHAFTIGTTAEGRPIRAIEISNNPGVPEDEPAIQFNAQHHSREVATSHVVVDVIETLTNGYGVDPQITAWVDSYKTVCVPMVNPDGVQYVFNVNSWWRKNRMNYGGSCIGVDPNRNYPYLWGPGCGSSSTCTSDTYRGPSSASENETQAMINLTDSYHFVMATSYHSSGRFIDYPYACADGSPSTLMPEHDVIHEMMNGMADAIDSFDGVPRYTVYSPVPFGGVNGDDTSWYYAFEGTYAFIVEVGTSFEPPFSDVPGIVGRNREGWKYLYERMDQARIDVHVTDSCSNQPLDAEVTLTDYVFDTGELARSTFLPFGRWTFITVPNDMYTVRASKTGYITQDVNVFVGGAPESVEIALELVSPPPQIYGDSDCDGDVDLDDYAQFGNCLTAPGGSSGVGCENFDADVDGDVDLEDFQMFQEAFTG